MTSSTDEITHLRRGLEDIRTSCRVHADDQEATHPTVAVLLRAIGQMANRALKTPRASKVVEPTPSSRWDDGGGSGGFGH